ncbi:MAG: hypothetical protein ABEH60_05590 [Halonotius sp.]
MAAPNTSGLSIPLPTDRGLYWALFLNSQLLAGALYVAFTAARATPVKLVAFAAVWINVGVWVVANSRPDLTAVAARTRRRALLVAAGYFAALAVAGGLVGVGSEAATGLRIAPLPPGYGPALLYSGEWVTINLQPNYLVGYAALAYLVYVTVIDAAGSAAAGLLGLFSCVSCSWPIIVSLVSGGSSVLVTAALQVSYGLSTAVFLVTAGLLYFRPAIFARVRTAAT